MLTAADAYRRSIEAEKHEIERRILNAADNGIFNVNVNKINFKHITHFIDVLESNGYDVKQNDNTYTISWENASSVKAAYNQ